EPRRAERGGAHGHERAGPGHRERHDQDRDGADAGGARGARPLRADAAAGPRRAPVRGAARGGPGGRSPGARNHGNGAAAPDPPRRRREVGRRLGGGMTRRFLLVGLTGGIATGKSTVAEVFRRLGCVIIDADGLAREVVVPGAPAHDDIVAAFGGGILRPDGTLDRQKLGAIVFAVPDAKKRLEAITHPRNRERFAEALAELEARDFAGIVIFDAPVMIESGNYTAMDRLVVVVTDAATQARRLTARAAPAASSRSRWIAGSSSGCARASRRSRSSRPTRGRGSTARSRAPARGACSSPATCRTASGSRSWPRWSPHAPRSTRWRSCSS